MLDIMYNANTYNEIVNIIMEDFVKRYLVGLKIIYSQFRKTNYPPFTFYASYTRYNIFH